MNREELLYEYLKAYHKGKKNAVHSKELQDRFKICSRTVRAYVNNLRKAGYPICSNDKGRKHPNNRKGWLISFRACFPVMRKCRPFTCP